MTIVRTNECSCKLIYVQPLNNEPTANIIYLLILYSLQYAFSFKLHFTFYHPPCPVQCPYYFIYHFSESQHTNQRVLMQLNLMEMVIKCFVLISMRHHIHKPLLRQAESLVNQATAQIHNSFQSCNSVSAMNFLKKKKKKIYTG